jgi:hypothetical protein
MSDNWRRQRKSAHYMCGHTAGERLARCDCHSIEVEALDDRGWRTITEQLLDDIVYDPAGVLTLKRAKLSTV